MPAFNLPPGVTPRDIEEQAGAFDDESPDAMKAQGGFVLSIDEVSSSFIQRAREALGRSA